MTKRKNTILHMVLIVIVCVVSFSLIQNIKDSDVSLNTLQQNIFALLKNTSIVQDGDRTDQTHIITAQEIVELTNQARISVDPTLAPLEKNSILTVSAQKKVEDMITKNYFEHENPEGYNVEYFVNSAGYQYISIAENLASGDFMSVQELIDAWMNSPGHRENILRPEMKDLGVAIVYGMFQGNMQYVAVQHFGRPKGDCTEANNSLQTDIENDENKIKELSVEITFQKEIIDNKNSNKSDYETAVQLYNSLVENYNKLSYTIKNNIEIYNKQVRAFNSCIDI